MSRLVRVPSHDQGVGLEAPQWRLQRNWAHPLSIAGCICMWNCPIFINSVFHFKIVEKQSEHKNASNIFYTHACWSVLPLFPYTARPWFTCKKQDWSSITKHIERSYWREWIHSSKNKFEYLPISHPDHILSPMIPWLIVADIY